MTIEQPAGSEAEPSDSPGAPPPRPSMLRNIAHLMTSQLMTWTLALCVQVAVPRYLGPAGIGRLQLAVAVWTMAQLFIAMGTSTFLLLETARDHQRGFRLLGPVITLRLAVFGVASVALIVAGVMADWDREAVFVFAAIGLSTLIGTVGDCYGAVLMGLERMSFVARGAVLAKVAYTVVVIAVLILGGGLGLVALSSAVSAAVGAIILWSASRRFGRADWKHPLGPIRTVVRASLVFLVASAALVVYQQIDTVVISVLTDSTTLGWYSTADTLFGTMLFLPTVLISAIAPRLGRLHVEDGDEYRRLSVRFASTLALLAIPIALGTAVVSDKLVVLLFGDEFEQSGPVLAAFCVVMLLTCGTILFGGIATTTARQRIWNLSMVAAIVVSVALDPILVPWTDRRFDNGALGGAFSYIVTESLLLASGAIFVARWLVDRSIVVRLGKAFVAGGLMVAVMWPLRTVFPLVPLAVGSIVYLIGVVVLRTPTQEEYGLLKQGLARVGIGRTTSVAGAR